MKTIDFSYYIERYNAGEMSDSEKKWFLKEIDGNEKLKNEVDLRKKTDEILKKQDIMALRNKLNAIERERKVEVLNPVKSSNIRYISKIRYIRYAAIIGGVAIIGAVTFFPGKNLNNDTIMKRYYKTYEPASNQRSANSATNADFALALEFYNTHDYERAAKLFSKVLENKPNDMQVVLLQGVSNFEEKKYPEAKQSFGKVIDDKNNLYVDQAEWYLALCYLNTNEIVKAKELFKEISNEDGIYKDDAKKIIKGLK